ncbi:MAG: aminodeoxychorismate/anthranilate synthase component II [Prevotellaceae bacterium]|jgi:anthranilate synthase component 2|nr:aminodeoxychorismate/anthranilate synthase component II [Prevotellaceae bacterium]
MKILVFDSYDSFTYNLVHALRKLGCDDVEVARNDQIALEAVARYDKIMLSPGPGIPSESGILLDLIKTYAATKSIFGVCLGMQAIGEAFGGTLVNLKNVYHGVSDEIQVVASDLLFDGLGDRFEAGRYHSWVVSPENFPESLHITATDGQGNIMALAHRRYRVRGVQFHPESVLTPMGESIIKNWIEKD